MENDVAKEEFVPERAEIVTAAYGYWPPFHDAHLLEVNVEGGDLVLCFYVYDLVEEGLPIQPWSARDLHTIIKLRCVGLKALTIAFDENSLDRLWLLRAVDASLEVRLIFFDGYTVAKPPSSISCQTVVVESLHWVEEEYQWRGVPSSVCVFRMG